MRDNTQFIETVIEAINAVRASEGHARPIRRDLGYKFGLVLLKRLEGYGFEIYEPQKPLIGGLNWVRKGK